MQLDAPLVCRQNLSDLLVPDIRDTSAHQDLDLLCGYHSGFSDA